MNTSSQQIKPTNDLLLITGELNFTTVMPLFTQSLPLIAARQSEIVFDLSEVTFTNSAALALMLEWVKEGKKQRKTIRFQGLPEKLVSIIKATGVNGLL